MTRCGGWFPNRQVEFGRILGGHRAASSIGTSLRCSVVRHTGREGVTNLFPRLNYACLSCAPHPCSRRIFSGDPPPVQVSAIGDINHHLSVGNPVPTVGRLDTRLHQCARRAVIVCHSRPSPQAILDSRPTSPAQGSPSISDALLGPLCRCAYPMQDRGMYARGPDSGWWGERKTL